MLKVNNKYIKQRQWRRSDALIVNEHTLHIAQVNFSVDFEEVNFCRGDKIYKSFRKNYIAQY